MCTYNLEETRMKSLITSRLAVGTLTSSIWPLAATANSTSDANTRFLATEDGSIAYDDTGGAGPLIIALPGMGDLRQQYRHLRPYLTKAGYRVVTMDVRGQGESSVQWNDYSAHAAGRDVLALMRDLQAPSAIVIGNSFAAGAAAWASNLAPDRIRGMVLIGPIMRNIPMSPWIAAVLKVGFMGPWRNWFWMTYWDSLFPTRKPTDHEQYRARLRHNLQETGRMRALQEMVGLSKADTGAILDKNRTPSLILMGTKDADFPEPAKEAELLAAKLQASVLLVEGAGHYPHTEMPGQVAPQIIAFLQQLK
jgi:pimeloyl-ACP methyl ester carboxylesterase